MQNKTTSLAYHASQVGLQIHPNKTKILKINASSREAVKLGDNNLEEVETFTYLGSVINQQGGTDADVKPRIGKARAAFIALKNIFRSNPKHLAPKSACSTPTSNQSFCMEQRRGEQQRPPSKEFRPSSIHACEEF